MTIPGGYILQPRKIDESEVFKMPPVARELWLYILRKVNHKDNEKYKRGQGFFCLNDVQNDLSWYVGFRKEQYSKPRLTKALRRLNEGKMTETMKATRGLIITVCNYDYYQEAKNYEGNGDGSMKVTRSDFGGHTKNKNVKNERKNKSKDIEEVVSLFNAKNKNMPPVQAKTQKRAEALNARIKEHGHESVTVVIDKATESDFLNGKNDKNWNADFDWIFKPGNYVKILEGNYDNRGPKQPKKIVITQEHKDMLNL